MRVHLFPSRTQKLSSSALTILGGRLPGKISNANTKDHNEGCGLLLYTFTERRLEQSTGLFLRRDDTLAYLEKFVTRTQEPLINVVAISLVKCDNSINI